MFIKQQVLLLVFFIETSLIKNVHPRKSDACKSAFNKLTPPENGRLQHTKNYRKAKYVCDKGFVIVPKRSEIVICKRGKYEGVPPTCEGNVFCPEPEGIDHGLVNASGKVTGSIANYSCVSNEYKLKGEQIRTCTSSGKWDGTPPVCEERRCQQLKGLRIKNGKWHATDPNHKLYSTIEFSCDKGYELDGPRALFCSDYGWTPRIATKCREPQCPPITFEHGRTCCGRTFTVNSTMTFKCNSGFKLVGPNRLICRKDKSWSETPPVCDDGAFDCVNPGIPISGYKVGVNYNHNDVVKFKCRSNFILVGSPNTTCINGTWTDPRPECIDKYDDRFLPQLNTTAKILKTNVIDTLKQSTCSSENATCDKRGRSIVVNDVRGLDIVFVLDKSSSIAKQDFLNGLKFVNKMIDTFGVSSIDDVTGTQIALVTYSHQATLEFNLGDDRASTPEGAKKLVSETQYSGGGTNTRAALELVDELVYPMSRRDSVKVLFIIADGNSNIGKAPEKKADELRELNGFHIHVLAVGKKINKGKLQLLADEPLKEHFFQLKDYEDLGKLMDAVKTEDKNVDYNICGQSPYDTRGRILGGSKTEKGEWPWIISLLENNKHKCGGSILDRGWILTAAHCFEDIDIQKGRSNQEPNTLRGLDKYQIVAGEYQRLVSEFTEQIRSPRRIYIHQLWERASYANDIALIRLRDEEDLQFSRLARPVCLPNEFPGQIREKLVEPGRSTLAVGWGRTTKAEIDNKDSKDKDASDVLLRTTMPIAESKKCAERAKVHGDHFSPEAMLCVGDGSGKNDTCYGDSGGPLVTQYFDQQMQRSSWVQVGIISWGKGCGQVNEYGYYTHLKNFVQWIEKTMEFDAMNPA